MHFIPLEFKTKIVSIQPLIHSFKIVMSFLRQGFNYYDVVIV